MSDRDVLLAGSGSLILSSALHKFSKMAAADVERDFQLLTNRLRYRWRRRAMRTLNVAEAVLGLSLVIYAIKEHKKAGGRRPAPE